MTYSAIRRKITSLPSNPGVYQFLDAGGKVMYVGKARNLRKRVQSYFTKTFENRKTAVMVGKVADIRVVITDTEYDALLLENNLIKKYQPRYNIQLRDDKSFPWICIKNERFPRIYGMRNPVNDGSEYYGPYASVKMMNVLLELAAKLYPIRTCSYNLSQENIAKKKFRLCLEYHVGNCAGPCEGLQTEEAYNAHIAHIRHILRGNTGEVIRHLKEVMKVCAGSLEYEKAQAVKEKSDRLERFQAKSTIVNPRIRNADVFAIVSDKSHGCVSYLKVVSGAIVQAHTVEIKKKLDESDEALLVYAVTDIRTRLHIREDRTGEVILPFRVKGTGGARVTVPKRGDRRMLLSLAEKNAKHCLFEQKQRMAGKAGRRQRANFTLEQAKADLRLPELPRHIECFDNSNLQGAGPVAALAVFRDGTSSKKDYRHFNIRTVAGPDDYASMEEVVCRRYSRLLDENQSLPQLIVIDGGKGQLSSAVKSLDRLGLRGRISIIGIAKKLEEIYFPGDSVPLYLDKKSATLKLIQRIRNEAHRFGIEHHRKRMVSGTVKSELDTIKGIGPGTRDKLLRAFKSVEGVQAASVEELAKAVGRAKAEIAAKHFGNR